MTYFKHARFKWVLIETAFTYVRIFDQMLSYFQNEYSCNAQNWKKESNHNSAFSKYTFTAREERLCKQAQKYTLQICSYQKDGLCQCKILKLIPCDYKLIVLMNKEYSHQNSYHNQPIVFPTRCHIEIINKERIHTSLFFTSS